MSVSCVVRCCCMIDEREQDISNLMAGMKLSSRPSHPSEIPPPFPAADGKWVIWRDFDGKKSFGRFTCKDCNHTWLSAHAQKRETGRGKPDRSSSQTMYYTQECKECKTRAAPEYLWKNTPHWRRAKGRSSESGSDHSYDPLCYGNPWGDYDDPWDDMDDDTSSGPHLRHLCEACQRGRCSAK